MVAEPGERSQAVKLADIYRAAARIFHQQGYHATSISQVAEAVHLTKAGLYYYIQGKQELLFGIMSYAMDLLEEQVVAKTRGVVDPGQRLHDIVAGHASLIVRDSSFLTILVNELEGLDPEHRPRMVRRQRAYVDLIRDTLAELQRNGKLSGIDPTIGAFGLLGMILWISRWYRPNGRIRSERVVETITKMALAAVGCPAPAATR